MSDKLGANNLANKGLKVGSNSVHALLEELRESLAERNQLSDTLGPLLDLEGVSVVDVHAHRDFHSVDDLAGLLLVQNDGFELLLDIFGQIVASGVTKVDNAGVNGVVIDNLGELREMPGEPLLQTHRERVDVLVHLLNQGDSLGDRLVLSVDILGALGAREGVTETKLGFRHISISEAVNDLGVV